MLDNGGVSWAIGLGLVLGFDLWLCRSGHKSLSSHARRHPALTATGLVVFIAHIGPPRHAPQT